MQRIEVARDVARGYPAAPRAIYTDASLIDRIRTQIGMCEPETGAMLGGRASSGMLTDFFFDAAAQRSEVAYSPNHTELNTRIKTVLTPAGLQFMGFVHSHPPGFRTPSGGDRYYSEQILKAFPKLDQMLVFIVQTASRPEDVEILPWVCVRQGDGVAIAHATLHVIGLPAIPAEPAAPEPAATSEPAIEQPKPRFPREFKRSRARLVRRSRAAFQRVVGAYDLARLANSRVVVVGTGGAAESVLHLTRSGVGELVLIDHDRIEAPNLATQHVYRRDLGRAKVEALADQIHDVNPAARVLTRVQALDEINDIDFERLANEPMRAKPPRTTLLCGFTDRFEAQARVNRLGLQLGLPTLCAQLYERGLAAELTFTHPQTTRACHACILQARYRKYLSEGYQNDVTSEGSPISATARVNALSFEIAMAILHHGSSHPRWGDRLARIGPRNLIQLRMDPACEMESFTRTFASAGERVLWGDTQWIRQDPEAGLAGRPACPECGGSGDLSQRRGCFADTRQMASGRSAT